MVTLLVWPTVVVVMGLVSVNLYIFNNASKTREYKVIIILFIVADVFLWLLYKLNFS